MTIKSHSNNITSTTDVNGGTITYRYNSMGQVHEVIDQEGNGEFLYCDEEGRREMQIDRNGNINRYHYTIDGALSYQRAEDKKGRYPVVNRYMYYPDKRGRRRRDYLLLRLYRKWSSEKKIYSEKASFGICL